MAVGLAAGFARAAWGLINPLKHKAMKAGAIGLDFVTDNDGEMTKGTLRATGEALDGNYMQAAEELGSSIKYTFQNITGTGEHATPDTPEASAEGGNTDPTLRERARGAVTFASDLADGKNPLTSDDKEGGVGGLFNSVMNGDIFNMDNAKTAGKWGLGGFLMLKILGWLKDSFSDSNKNENDNNGGGGGLKTALTLAIVVGAGAFIYNKYGDDIKHAAGLDGDTPKVASSESAPKPQNLDSALQGYDMG